MIIYSLETALQRKLAFQLEAKFWDTIAMINVQLELIKFLKIDVLVAIQIVGNHILKSYQVLNYIWIQQSSHLF